MNKTIYLIGSVNHGFNGIEFTTLSFEETEDKAKKIIKKLNEELIECDPEFYYKEGGIKVDEESGRLIDLLETAKANKIIFAWSLMSQYGFYTYKTLTQKEIKIERGDE